MSGNKSKKKKKGGKAIKRIIFLFLILVLLFIVLAFITPTESEMGDEYNPTYIENLEIPRGGSGEIIEHTGYTLSYSEEYEVPEWVAYELTREEVITQAVERKDNFREDKAVSTGSATLNDYKKSGYDRGHMAPAADFRWSFDAMNDTFYLSNMCPQTHAFNAGIWSDLEEAVRSIAYEDECVYVVTGPVLTDGPYETIGENEVAVPKYFYKVILDYTLPTVKAIGFIMPHENSKEPLSYFAVTVDEVEEITGLDFFPLLPDDEEERLESSLDTTLWALKNFDYSLIEKTTDEGKVYVEETTPESEVQKALLDTFMEVFYTFKKEVFQLLGIEKEAKAIGLL
ncbi:MAG: DNA/RNA non-specific endonuclease [Candidatus Ornithospirochaeta sp.]